MKLPNGYGSITKLSGHRRKPFWVRTACKYDSDGNAIKESRITLGYYATKREAIAALEEFNKDPYDLSANKLTFGEVVQMWESDYKSKLSENTMKIYLSSLSGFKELFDIPMKSISLNHLQPIVSQKSKSMQAQVKNVLCSVYDYAMKREIVTKNVSFLLETERKDKSTLHHPYTADEIQDLWNKAEQGSDISKFALCLIYSGWRISELLDLDEIDYDKQIMIGGIKTKAGRGRTVPIHHRILPLIKELDGTYINANVSYDKISGIWRRNISEHTPHDTRHTFVSILQSKQADFRTIQKLVGHASNVTDDVYTHKTIDELRSVVEMID